jgi:sulfur relay protein TusB/DsrH
MDARRPTALHLVLSSGPRALEACRARCEPGDAVLFLDEGVNRLLDGEPGGALPDGIAVLFSWPDLEARGLAEAAQRQRLKTLQDDDFPALLERHRHCLSWK